MIRKYERDGKTLFHVSVRPRARDGHGVRLYRQVKDVESLAKAEKIEKKLLLDVATDLARRGKQGIRWGDLVEKYANALYSGTTGGRPVQRTTAQDMTQVLEKYTREWFSRPAMTIERTDVIELFRRLDSDGATESRKKSIKTAIGGAFKFGIENRLIPGLTSSPTVGIAVKYKVEKKPEVLTPGEAKVFLEAALVTQDPWYPIWAMALLTGMRSGELIALRWTDVDLENKVITVEKSYNGRMKVVKSTKSGHWRQVPINRPLLELLERLRAESNGRPEVLPRIQDWIGGRAASKLRAFLKSVGLKPIKFHALRATFATMLLRNGIPAVQVMRLCGWADLKTMQFYVGLAGVDIAGSTDCLQILPPADVMGKVVKLLGP